MHFWPTKNFSTHLETVASFSVILRFRVMWPNKTLRIVIYSKFAEQNLLCRQGSAWFKHNRIWATCGNTRLNRERWHSSQRPQIKKQCKRREYCAPKVMWRLHLEAKYIGSTYHLWMPVGISGCQKHVLNSISDNNVYWYSILDSKENTIVNFHFNLAPPNQTVAEFWNT